MEKENWINDVMSSMDEPLDLSVSENLFQKIERKIKDQEAQVIPIRWVLAAAASILILVSINLNVLLNNNNSNFATEEVLSTNVYDQSNQLY